MTVTASDFSVPLEALFERTAWLAARVGSIFAPVGADPTGVADSTTSIQDAINAAEAAGGGVVHVAAGFYLHTGLTLPDGVHLDLAPGCFLAINHATNDHITLTEACTYLPNLIRGGSFVGNITNDGSVFRASAANSKAGVLQASFNSAADTALEGRFGRADAAGAKLLFRDCPCDVAGAQRAFEASGGGAVKVQGGRIKMPATYAAELMYVNNASRGDLEGVDIDLTAHTTGSAWVLLADSASRAGMRDCRIDATGMSGNVTGFAWSTAARVLAKGNEWEGSGALTVYGAALAAAGSDIELVASGRGSSGGASYTIADGYRSFALLSTSSSSPTITLPTVLFEGQELDLTIYKQHVSSWGLSFANYLYRSSASPTLTNNTGATARFVAQDPTGSGTPGWVQIGEWATVTP
jgi:polygalacturonase